MLQKTLFMASRACLLAFIGFFPVIAVSAPHSCNVIQGFTAPPLNLTPQDDTYQLNANQITAYKNQRSIAQGDVVFARKGSVLWADRLVFDHEAQRGSADGAVLYQTARLWTRAESGDFQLSQQTGQLTRPEFLFVHEKARGSAATMEVIDENISWLYKATITTCPPQKSGWLLSAKKIKVDLDHERVTAHNVILRFKSMPIFYSPYLSFSLNERRKSGFLLPNIAATDKSGFELTLPFYWNIAPNKDATFFIQHLQKRGALLKGHYRYLNQYQRGNLAIEYLPNDRLRSEARGRFFLAQRGAYPKGWHTNAVLQYASDKNYFIDLGESLGTISQTHLNRSMTVGLTRNTYSATARLQNFQTLDKSILPESRPYQRLPQLKLNTHHRLTPSVQLNTDMEAVNFQRSNSLTGTRVHIEPKLSFVEKTAAVFFSSDLGLSHTSYFLKNSLQDNRPQKTLPFFNLRSRLLFERPISLGKTAMIQTIEPEIFYLYVPLQDQTQLPVFDTTELDFSFGQLFRTNRFSGSDRMGDANQLSLALTSNLLRSEDGRERLKLSVGQIRYFRDRKVTLPGKSTATQKESNIIADLRSQIAHHWEVSSQIQWDPHKNTAEKTTFRTTYRKSHDRFFTLAYRFRKEQLEQTDIAFVWPLSRWLKGVSRWHYSLPKKRTLNTLLGLQYESCCWTVSLFMSNFLNEADADATQVVFLQLELKGLSSLGSRIDRVLRQEIPSYH